ncbi:hypothetical protein L1987_56919 [Smallanthus sonchifolius]|uniref:Uncharacterized protein n=1 Tax=Smallanthus sonchifolius TaxID=185202 RepID=A0ACB9DBE4_9ASTR|nr:hypothetical protein L1987_56919 [Smallanthus sonchifolius]
MFSILFEAMWEERLEVAGWKVMWHGDTDRNTTPHLRYNPIPSIPSEFINKKTFPSKNIKNRKPRKMREKTRALALSFGVHEP